MWPLSESWLLPPWVGGDAVTLWLGSPHWVGGDAVLHVVKRWQHGTASGRHAEGGRRGSCPLSSKALGGDHSFI